MGAPRPPTIFESVMKTIEGQHSAANLRFGIVAARFNGSLVDALISGAVETLEHHGALSDKITLVRVPGSFEIPLACKALAQSHTVDAIIALGVVIRGDTLHFELICNSASDGITQASLETGLPIAHGIIAAEDRNQAIERTGGKLGNKGAEAALAAIEMAHVVRMAREGGE